MADKGFVCMCGGRYFSLLHSDLELDDAVHGVGPGTLAVEFKCDACGVTYKGTGAYPVSFAPPDSMNLGDDDGAITVTLKYDRKD